MKKVKISVLGGSGVCTPELVHSLLERAGDLPEADLVLHGRSEEKLQIVGSLCQRMARRVDAGLQVKYTTDLREALAGADFVTNQIRVGGLRARARDEAIALQLGVVEEETMGIVGLANVLRTVRVVLQLTQEVERTAPQAWFINLTNPCSIVIGAVRRQCHLRIFGCCDQPESLASKIAEILGVPRSSLWLDYIGLNHLAWVSQVYVDRKPSLEALLAQADQLSPLGVDPQIIVAQRLIPLSSLRYYYHPDRVIQAFRMRPQTRGEELVSLERELLETYRDPHLDHLPELLHRRQAVWYSVVLVPLLVSMIQNQVFAPILILPNESTLSQLPPQAIIEAVALTDAHGPRPLALGATPTAVKGLIQAVQTFEQLAVAAVQNPSDEAFLSILLAHPLVPSYEVARKALPYLRSRAERSRTN
jgi:6-phospho-beta-glucosidase